jgi:hypothetical protein
MLTAFFYAKGVIHHEFVPEKETVNGTFYKEVIKRLIALIARVRHVWPEFQESEPWYLLQNNVPAHSLGPGVFGERKDSHVIPSTLLP